MEETKEVPMQAAAVDGCNAGADDFDAQSAFSDMTTQSVVIINSVDKRSIRELKSFANPPQQVKDVL
mgnify:CR=1 FL=1